VSVVVAHQRIKGKRIGVDQLGDLPGFLYIGLHVIAFVDDITQAENKVNLLADKGLHRLTDFAVGKQGTSGTAGNFLITVMRIGKQRELHGDLLLAFLPLYHKTLFFSIYKRRQVDILPSFKLRFWLGLVIVHLIWPSAASKERLTDPMPP
jgi:hypothetical protein